MVVVCAVVVNVVVTVVVLTVVVNVVVPTSTAELGSDASLLAAPFEQTTDTLNVYRCPGMRPLAVQLGFNMFRNPVQPLGLKVDPPRVVSVARTSK